MRENFTIKVPNSINFGVLPKMLISLIISIIIIYPILGLGSIQAILSIIILFLIIYIIISSMTTENLSNELEELIINNIQSKAEVEYLGYKNTNNFNSE